ncbi:MAG TPA: AraC family transcriptional regulator [Ignavibacteria bacterium]
MIYEDRMFYRYLTTSEADKNWGLYVTGAGYTEVSNHVEYPLIEHPQHHYFHFSKGRRLSEYQVLYITKGEGIFESEESGEIKIKSGDIFILFPGIWHRFSPNISTGWDEYWIEFNGHIADHLQKRLFLNPQKPVISIGLHEEILDNFMKVISIVRSEELTLQFNASGTLFQILGQIFTVNKNNSFEDKSIESKIKQAKTYISENINVSLSPEKIANTLNISYSLFRKEFKKHLSFSPIQFQIQLRIQEAKRLLTLTNTPIKNIAYQLGFQSCYYFSRIFKVKVGKSPHDFREESHHNPNF